jgi:hypothetical protein
MTRGPPGARAKEAFALATVDLPELTERISALASKVEALRRFL